MTKSIDLAALVVVCLVTLEVNGHSWIACTDYAEKNAANYDHNLCRGWARNARTYAPKGGTFGADRGFDHHPGSTNPCKSGRDDSVYDFDHPMAVYYPGQQVVLAHPMKNHGSDYCTNNYIPDNGNWIYRGNVNAAFDSTLEEFKNNKVADLGISPTGHQNPRIPFYPKPGFQNAPNFCDNTDKALGTYSFNVPSDLTPGQYTFIWLWGFNSPQDLYSTCFEVEIVNNLSERNARLQQNGFANLYEPCGELTSDDVTMGNSNPGCTPPLSSSSTNPTTSTTQSTYTTTTTVGTTTTTPATTTTTTTQGPGEVSITMLADQMTGEINLPLPDQGTQRRYLSVHFDCPVVANFWNVRVIGQHNVGDGKRRRKRHTEGVHYDLLQEGYAVGSGKFYYHATFLEPCNLQAFPPIAKLIRDEK